MGFPERCRELRVVRKRRMRLVFESGKIRSLVRLGACEFLDALRALATRSGSGVRQHNLVHGVAGIAATVDRFFDRFVHLLEDN